MHLNGVTKFEENVMISRKKQKLRPKQRENAFICDSIRDETDYFRGENLIEIQPKIGSQGIEIKVQTLTGIPGQMFLNLL